jgi:hypothetical protein
MLPFRAVCDMEYEWESFLCGDKKNRSINSMEGIKSISLRNKLRTTRRVY